MGQVSLQGIHKRFGDQAVIRGIDLEVADGEFVVFVGPSGCGKTTTLRMIAGLESITEGELRIDGVRCNDVHPAARGAAMVFQSYALYPHMTVAENMGFALRMAGVSARERDARVREVARVLRLDELLDRLPKALSGGQRQRVAIGRAIVRQPKVFLFDEPLSNLDAGLRVEMRIELRRLHQEIGTTMIYVTHDQVEAMTLGDRIAVFNQGRIEQVGAPMELYWRPANRFVAEFLGAPKINIIEKPKVDSSAAHQTLWHTLTRSADARVACVAVRPEQLQIGTGPNGAEVTVMLAEHLGDHSIVHLRIEGLPELLRARIDAPGLDVTTGATVRLVTSAATPLVFDGEGRRLEG